MLKIQRVTDSRQWRDFFSLKRQIYAGDSCAVIPLKKMERVQLDQEKNPFYLHAQREAFICYRNDVPVGRIAAIKDDLHNEYNDDAVGFFGFFETIDDDNVVKLLIDAANDWLAEQGCSSMRGPVNPSMKSDFGVLIDGHDSSPTIMMGHSPKRYEQHLLDQSFSIAKTFYAFRFRYDKNDTVIAEKWKHMADAQPRIMARYPELRFAEVDKNSYAKTLRDINALGNTVRSEGWGFVPLTEPELEFMIKNLRQVIRFDMIRVAYWNDRLVGYIVNIPDVNWALKNTVGRWDWLRMIQMPFLIRRTPKTRVIALGSDPAFRKKGVAMMLIQKLIEVHHEYQEWELSWVLDDNLKSIRAIERALPVKRYKTYRLYERAVRS